MSPTGRRIIPYEQLRQQEEAAWRMHQKMRRAVIEAGGREVAPDMFDFTTADYESIERRIRAAMAEEE